MSMAPSKLRRAIGAVKDKTSIGLAMVSNNNSLSDLDVAIVKATRHEEYPAEEKYIREILSLTSYSKAYISSCVNTLTKRLNKTKNWTVALKTLILIQRLIAEGDPSYEQEIFFSTRRGTRLLNMSDFRDASKSYNSWDYSAFVRTYALYLDERLEFRMQGKRGKRSAFGFNEEDEEVAPAYGKSTPVRDMKNEHVFSRVQHLQQLLERFLACRPTGAAKNNRVVIVALYPVVKESYQIYYEVTEILGILIDRFMELEISNSVKVYEIFCRVSKQLDELDSFYLWCKTVGIGRSSEYPEVEKITQKKLDLMDDFIRDKTALAQTKRGDEVLQLKNEPEEEPEQQQEAAPIDMNTIKALPAPESFIEAENKKEQKEAEKGNNLHMVNGDLLNLSDDTPMREDEADKLALALFDAEPAKETPAWEAFNDDVTDWEMALVECASNLSNQKTTLGGGFDKLLLDGMYQQGALQAAMANSSGAHGSASSVAIPSSGQPMLALPAPLVSDGRSATGAATSSVDPFAASLAVPLPPYVQMPDMEKKQRLLVEEQLMWQQYARDGMQGQVGMAKLQPPNPYMGGSYTQYRY